MAELTERLHAQLGPNFEIERELGGGGMSRVFLARDRALDREVAIKVLAPELAATVSVERFRREIMFVAALQHPNIVPVLSAGEVDGLPYFLMPFVRGESLRVRLQRGPLSIRETITVLKDVARALAYAHERDVIHRDIKPDNILISAGAAAVADFGVAKAIVAARHVGPHAASSTMTGAGISLGTPAYMAPEQVVADPEVDQRADLYSLGVVGYEMLVGVPPFHGRPPAALLAAHLQEIPPPIVARRYDVPDPLIALVMQCLEKDPRRRPRSAQAILGALDDTNVSTDALSAVRHRPRRRGRRWRRWATGAAIAVTLLAVAWGSALIRGSGTSPADTTSLALRGRSIAVTALRGTTGDAHESAAAASLTSDLTSAVSGVRGLRVASQGVVASDSAAPLAADLRLEGTVQREGGRLRVNVRLVDVRRDSTVWALTHDGSVDSLFVLQDAVTSGAVAALNRP